MTKSENKFTRLTAQIIVRKGDAAPSEIHRPNRRKTDRPPLSLVTPNESAKQWDDQPGDDGFVPKRIFERTLNERAPKKPRRMVIKLTEEEHQTLGIVAVKKGFTRHEVLRKALDAYLEWLAEQYGTSCQCISSTCATECDPSSGACVAKRTTEGD